MTTFRACAGARVAHAGFRREHSQAARSELYGCLKERGVATLKLLWELPLIANASVVL